MATLTETQHAGEFIISEASGTRSRETITVLSGQDLSAGAVVGKVASGAGSGKYKEYNPANVDGSETAVGVLFDGVDASAADKAGVIMARDAEVTSADLQWFSGATSGQKTTGESELATLGIIAR